MSEQENSLLFQDYLKVEGINFKGFGILPKYVMIDSDLTIEAKTIYAYFCSFAGAGNTAFPSRDTILYNLPMSKDAYYNHFKLLKEQEYIIVEQERKEGSVFSKNTYILISNPKKFEEVPVDNKQALAYSKIRFSGLKSVGYGMIPKSVMIDERLSVKAKGVYAYFCSFTGSGNNAFPKLDKILYHLQITKNTYYKFYQQLISLNYITVVQRHINGRLSVNDYYLNETPDKANASPKAIISAIEQLPKKQDTEEKQDTKIQLPKKQDTEQKQFPKIQLPKKQDTEKQYPKKQDTIKQDNNNNNSNNNNFENNSFKINQSNNQQPAQPEYREIEGLNDDELEQIIYKEIREEGKIPYWYNRDEKRMTVAVHILVEYKNFMKKGYKDKLVQNAYMMFIEALIEMCCSDKPMILKGSHVTYAKVIERLNDVMDINDEFISIMEFADSAIEDYSDAIRKTDVKNYLQYMKACIWSSLQTYKVKTSSELSKMGIYEDNWNDAIYDKQL